MEASGDMGKLPDCQTERDVTGPKTRSVFDRHNIGSKDEWRTAAGSLRPFFENGVTSPKYGRHFRNAKDYSGS